MRSLSAVVVAAAIGVALSCSSPEATAAKDIVHDAEFYVLKAQHGDKWAEQDKELKAKLKALKKKYGTPPNIVHIMWDDSPVGDVGLLHLQKNRGYETPQVNKLASEGIYFTRMYTEPSCTPSRAASITGRHPIRNGMYNVGFPYEYGGMPESEVTIAEVLSKAGYATAFYGKGHLGDIEESYMTNMGYDEALWMPYNQVPSLYTVPGQLNVLLPTSIMPELYPEDPYDMDKGWRVDGYVWALEGKKGGPVREWGTPPNHDDYIKLIGETKKRVFNFIDKNAKAKKPFYVAYWPIMNSFLGMPEKKTVSSGIVQEFYARFDPWVGELMAKLKGLGIAENTLVILMADNGPMVHNGPPGMVETLYRGGKGDYTEGAVRVPALAWWPGMIDSGQVVGDIIHITDLYTTFANIGGAKQYIPRDRIIDGIDQTSLFLNGDTYSRRDYVHIYTGSVYAATVKGRFKRKWVGELPGLSGAAFFDLYNDPREASPKMLPGFPTKGMFSVMKARHELWMEKYPNTKEARGMPFTGIENARPATIRASKHRFKKGEVPFDVEEVMKKSGSSMENFESNWGI